MNKPIKFLASILLLFTTTILISCYPVTDDITIIAESSLNAEPIYN